MTQEHRLLIERREHTLLLTLDNPKRRNALHPDFYRQGREAVEQAAADPNIGAIVLTGTGEHFCSGGNLQRLAANREMPQEIQRGSLDTFHRWILALRACPKPIIAAVEGAAAGAGFSLALACDMIVAARDARFSMAYVKVGLTPDGGGTAFLADLLPRQAAAELALLGAPVGAERLFTLGVVNRLAEPGKACTEALTLAHELALGAGKAQGRIKRLLNAAGAHERLAAQLDRETDSFVAALFDSEAAIGIAAFSAKEPPRYR